MKRILGGVPKISPAKKLEIELSDPFKLVGPVCISFSGGRTSAYMLWRVLQSHGGVLPDDVVVCFANTGKEVPETLDFVQECSDRWGVHINWLEYRPKIEGEKQFVLVDHATASRNGEPFEAIVRDRRYLPNPVSRFCTAELKIRVMHRFLRSLGWKEWDQAIGVRHDEQSRVAKLRGRAYPEGNFETPVIPLADAGITRFDIKNFWDAAPFDLRLPNINGTTPLGNCDLCFLKGATRITSILRESPEKGIWWARMETEVAKEFGISGRGGTFRSDRATYQQMLDQAGTQQVIDFGDEPILDCMCVD